jgi:hypothetical protein
MADAAWTQDDIDTLKEAIASGIMTVTYGGNGSPTRTVTYQSLQAMRALLAGMLASVSSQAGTRKKIRFAATKKGFE